jgi:trimethylamine---corrinoid protein Co-methyltransferase
MSSSERMRRRRSGGGVRRLPWRLLERAVAPVEVLDEDRLELIHDASMTVLEGTGMRVLHPEARRLFASAGASVDSETMMVRFDRDMIAEHVAAAPASFRLRARNAERDLVVGGRNVVFNAVGGPAYVHDLDRGRRSGTYAEMCDYLRLIQSLDIIHQEGGGPFEPMDLDPRTRHLDLHLAQIRLLDKNWQAVTLGHDRTTDGIEMACIALGTDRRGLAAEPALLGIINTNTPLQLDIPMAEGAIALAEAGQVACITPFTLAGAMAPATLAGALVLQNAEALVGVTLTQIVRPGVPVMYGSFTSNVDMRSGSPAFGTPEYTKAAQAAGQLARRYALPFRSSNTTASNAPDGQAMYESMMSLWGAVMGGAHLVNHAAGWLEGGLTAGFEKLVMDAETLQLFAEYLQPVEVTADTLGLDAIAEVGPGGHFFASGHTMQRYEHAFYSPMLSDWRNFESWEEAGSVDATRRANGIWKQLLSEYEQPPLDPATDEQLVEYVERRKEEIGRT